MKAITHPNYRPGGQTRKSRDCNMPTKPWQRPRDTLSLAHDMSGGRPTLRDFRRMWIRAADGVRASLHSENTLSFRRVVPTLRKQCSVGQPILWWLTAQRPEAGPAPQIKIRRTHRSRFPPLQRTQGWATPSRGTIQRDQRWATRRAFDFADTTTLWVPRPSRNLRRAGIGLPTARVS